jgi:hypothetical protein
MKAQIKYVANLASAAEDYHLAQQLYAILFDLQLRDEDATARLAARLDECDGDPCTRLHFHPAPDSPHRVAQAHAQAQANGERLRLLPRMGPVCLKCGTVGHLLDEGGLCSPCRTLAP